jgi:hypothetical protein
VTGFYRLGSERSFTLLAHFADSIFGAMLFAAGTSGYFGVQAGRAAIDFALKAWNGWPTFLIFLGFWIAFFYIPFGVLHSQPALWPLILAGLQCLVSVGASFIGIARKETIS